ncbi:zinc-dependent alcohol dehydrogenase [Pseudonocardia lacus]|uniref:zinc-dependent alcohol dehydrogenase n=1 Tax=Pseudonocardia lacus TaxID=2835865 RepID=UPI001BDC34C3|nr:alcohol dehydrogenase catalytic domain-containing protein [Pseudonocardia lacus]
MRAALWEGIGSVGLAELPDPEPGPADLVIDVGACGICGSDVHAFAEGAWISPGSRMGHEFAGTVRAVGAEVRGIAVGDRVAVNPMGPCGGCAQCAVGNTNLCAAPVHGAGGGLADRVLVPRALLGRRVFRLPDGLSLEEGAFLEPLSVAVRAVRSAALDEPILVTGLGSIGQCALRALLAYGATDVVGIDVSPPRLAAGAAAGATVLDARDGVDALKARLLDRWGTSTSPYQLGSGNAGTVVECSGALPMLELATAVTRAAGTIVVAGLTSRTPPLDVNTVVQKELRLRGSFAYTADDAAEAFRLLAEGHVRVDDLVTHRVPLARVAEAFAAQHAVDGSIKVVVIP